MTNGLRTIICLVVIGAPPAILSAQSQCRGADSATIGRIASVKKMMISSDSRWTATRTAYNLPIVNDTAIVVVADSATCASAASAYNGALPSAARVSGRSVYVIRVGSTRYVVWDISSVDGLDDEHEVVVVLDSSYNVLGSFAT